MVYLKPCVLFSVIYCVFTQELSVISTKTDIGEIIGQIREDFTTYLGVPYGYVAENDPFGPATPYPHFKTPFKAFTDLALCPQLVNGVPTGTIHCLQLNIYTPNHVYKSEKLPVMVFIHGGAFVDGNSRLSTYSPNFLIRHNVIVVTIHYRLGPYGFLCLKDTEYMNQGFKDQKLALKWVKDNIKNFGGNDESVTLFGHSAGSMSSDFQLLFTENLFDKVILQSGNAVTPTFYGEENTRFINDFANEIGLSAEKMNKKVFINTISIARSDYVLQFTQNYTFKICIDGTFVKRTPNSDLKNFKIMVGSTLKEALYLYPNNNRNFTANYDFKTALQQAFSKMDDPATELVKNFYLQDGVSQFVSDWVFNYPLERSIRFYVENNATVYRYLFNYDGGRNFMKVSKNIKGVGTTHADELGYIFDMDLLINTTVADQVIIDRMTQMWTDFAKYGDPTPRASALVLVPWLPITEGAKPYLNIDTRIGLRYGSPFEKETSFWDSYYERYGQFYKGISLSENWDQSKIRNNSFMNKMSGIWVLVALVVVSVNLYD